tara:strand:+ start:46 stop:639 length:594 start_codon:yes stop_codon:yes gene_type:complete
MSWWNLLKSENRLWEKISNKLYEQFQKNPSDPLRRTIRVLLNYLIREDYTKSDTKPIMDSLVESGNSNLVNLIGFYNLQFIKNPHKFIPKKVADVIKYSGNSYRFGFNSFADDLNEPLMKNFEGFYVIKQVRRDTYGKGVTYFVRYISNGFVFQISTLNKDNYRVLFNKFIKGQIILEQKITDLEKFPLRKIRARGI